MTRLGNARESVLKLSAGVFEDRSIAGVRIASGVLDVFCHDGHVYGSSVGAAAGGRYFGAVLLVDTTTGEPIALVQDWHLTQLAVSTCAAIAAGCLARANVRSIGVLGAGVQARQQLQALRETLGPTDVSVFTPRRGDAAAFAGEMADLAGGPIATCRDPRLAVDGRGVVITATSAPGAVIESDWVNAGTHLSVTHPSEVPDSLFARRPRIVSIGSTPARLVPRAVPADLERAAPPRGRPRPRLSPLACGGTFGNRPGTRVRRADHGFRTFRRTCAGCRVDRPCGRGAREGTCRAARSEHPGRVVAARQAFVTGPLHGIRVLEIASFVSGPMAGRFLADLGAEVIKIEHPVHGDPMRSWRGDLYSAWFIAHNVGKRSMTLRFGTEEAAAVIDRMLPGLDVVIQNFRPGVAERFGVGNDHVRSVAPHIVYCSISGAGCTGPYADLPFYDTIGQSLSGLLSQLMDEANPQPHGPALADNFTAMFAAAGILAALLERTRTSTGQHVETSVLGASLALLAEPFSVMLNAHEVPDGASRRRAAQVFVVACGDGRLIALHLSSPSKNWEALLRAIDRRDLASDRRFSTRPERIRHYEELRQELVRTFSAEHLSVWLEALRKHRVPCAPVNTLVGALADAQIQRVASIRSARHPRHGCVRWLDTPLRSFSDQCNTPRPAPDLGEDTDVILGELGYLESQIGAMRASGVI